ncbi:MAG: glycosyltransferase family 4 protein [Gaiellaceae bacterium]
MARRPRVALVAHGIHDGGGMERAFAELIRRLHDRYEIVVFSTDLAPDLRELVEWRRVPAPGRPAPLRFALFYALAAARLLRARADIVHTLGAIVPNRAHVATVQFCHAGFRDVVGRLAPPRAPLARKLNTGLARLLCLLAERWSYRPERLALLAPVSRGIALELARHFPRIPFEVTPNGVDRERFRPDEEARSEVRRSLRIGEDEVVAIFVGGDWDRKGLALAIGALERARQGSSRAIRLLVVGRGDEVRFRALARELGVQDDVLFLGPRSDTQRFYAAADVFVFPTLYEAFPLVALEAAASGLPIVAPGANGIEELLAGSGAGVMVARTSEEIGDALARLGEDAQMRSRLGVRARRLSSRFTWDRSASSVEAIYRSLARVA